MATRKASQLMLDATRAARYPRLFGGSADLTGSNLTDWKGSGTVREARPAWRQPHELGRARVRHGRHRSTAWRCTAASFPFGGTFLTFSDYSRNAIRMAALMKQRVVHVFTHDSIGLGEDGPTHQPVEHAMSLRLIPDLDVWRPGDEAETAMAWLHALTEPERPSALLLSRQNLAAQTRTPEQAAAMRRGGYVLKDAAAPRALIVATGSELALAMAAQALLQAQGVPTRVVSMPSTSVFDRQDKPYRRAVLLLDQPELVRVAVEAGSTRGWAEYGCCAALGLDRFGESAPGPALMKHFGFTPEGLADLVLAQIEHQHPRVPV